MGLVRGFPGPGFLTLRLCSVQALRQLAGLAGVIKSFLPGDSARMLLELLPLLSLIFLRGIQRNG
jgi:hypothetical protein